MGMPVLIGLLLVVVVLAFIISRQPDTFRVTRTTITHAQPFAVFSVVSDMKRWNEWSPWAKMDPDCKYEFEGPTAGVGAIYKWTGNSKVGAGKMTITETQSPNLVRIKLEFYKPFKGINDVEFTFRPETSGTLVSWSMAGKNTFISKAMSLVMNCDKMVGGSFEQGLAALKTIVEQPAAA